MKFEKHKYFLRILLIQKHVIKLFNSFKKMSQMMQAIRHGRQMSVISHLLKTQVTEVTLHAENPVGVYCAIQCMQVTLYIQCLHSDN